MAYVIDCSFSSSLFLPDENSLISVDFFKHSIGKSNIFIPLLWLYETSNVIYVAIKRKRITIAQSQEIFNLLNLLNLETDYEYGLIFSNNILNISNWYSISAYDAVYLELAIRKKAQLSTFDTNLKSAAKQAGANTIPAY